MENTHLNESDFRLVTETYFRERNFIISKIPELRKAKTPDYEITRVPHLLTYLAELKAPELHLNLNTGMYMHLTKIRKLRQFTQKALAQFESADKVHSKPRIMIFTSSYFQFHGKNLMEALLGYIDKTADFRDDKIVKETQSYIKKVDLFIWLQVSPKSKLAYQATLIKNLDSKFKTSIESITLELRRMPLSSMDHLFNI